MTTALWTDSYEHAQGSIVFVVRVADENAPGNPSRYALSDRPCYTNQSHEPRLTGWCGTTNNRARFAQGLAVVSRVTANGRAQLRRIPAGSKEERAALEALGYPELAR